MKYSYYDKYIGKDTILRSDVTPLFEDPKVFSNLVSDLVKPLRGLKIDKVVAIDALGFVLGTAMAQKLGKGMVLARKGGKLPYEKSQIIRQAFTDYTKKRKALEMKKSSIKKGDKVIIVDEWIETGAQVRAVIKIVEKLGGRVVGISTICCDDKAKDVILKRYTIRAIHVLN